MEQVHFHLKTLREAEIDFSGKWSTFLMAGFYPPQPFLKGSQAPVASIEKKKMTDMQMLFPTDSSSAAIQASIMEVL